jgi:hypothetical protein
MPVTSAKSKKNGPTSTLIANELFENGAIMDEQLLDSLVRFNSVPIQNISVSGMIFCFIQSPCRYEVWPDSVENPFYSTSGIFKPISGLCRCH